MKVKLGLFLSILVAVFVLHRSYLAYPFSGDDFYFFHPASQGVYGANLTSWQDLPGFWSPVRGWYFRPVFLTYFSLVSLAVGDVPIVFHALGLVLHAAVIAVLAWLVWRLTRQAPLAIACAVAYMLWPGKSEAVWSIASHSALLASLFSLASLHCWMSWRIEKKRGYFALALLCFWLALCSKNDAASLPVALLLVDAWHDTSQGTPWRDWLRTLLPRAMEFVPFVLGLVLFVGLEISAARSYAMYGDPGVGTVARATTRLRFVTAVRFMEGLWLGLFHIHPLGAGTVLAAGAITLIARRCSNGLPIWLFLLWGVAAALPVPLTSTVHAFCERFVYIPAIPISCAFVFLTVAVCRAVLRSSRFDGVALFILAIVVPLVASRLAIKIGDPAVEWMVLFLGLSTAFVLWRVGGLSSTLLVLLVFLTTGTQLGIFGAADGNAYLLVTLLMAAVLGWRTEGWLMAWCAPFFLYAVWTIPVQAIPLAIAGGVLYELYRRGRLARDVSTDTASLAPVGG